MCLPRSPSPLATIAHQAIPTLPSPQRTSRRTFLPQNPQNVRPIYRSCTYIQDSNPNREPALGCGSVHCPVSSPCGPSPAPLLAHLYRRKPMKPILVPWITRFPTKSPPPPIPHI